MPILILKKWKPAAAAALKQKQAEGATSPPETPIPSLNPTTPNASPPAYPKPHTQPPAKELAVADGLPAPAPVQTLPHVTEGPASAESQLAVVVPANSPTASHVPCPANSKPLPKPVAKRVTSAVVLQPPALLTLPQIADHLQVCVKTVRRRIKDLNVPVVYVGKQIKILPEHVVLFTTKKW